jgi:uronate dehydrogenase
VTSPGDQRPYVLITGAAGRVGSVLVEGLADRRLRLTDQRHPEDYCRAAEFIEADLTDPAVHAPLVAGVDSVIHLAGLPDNAPWEQLDAVNVRPTRSLIAAAARASVRRFIYASSVHVVGNAPADARLHDEMPLRPDGPYGWSKAVGELSLRMACEREAMGGIAVRICAFQPHPADARQLRLWLSPGDLVRLITACLDAPFSGFRTIWGVSGNARASLDRAGWEAVGYHPEDDAHAYAATLKASGIDTTLVSEWPLLGGRIAEGRPA